jgi:hypothetical protein
MSLAVSLIANETEQLVFEYLFRLQESGATNMFGAAAYIVKQPEFSKLSVSEAIELVNKWMNNYDAILKALSPHTIELK